MRETHFIASKFEQDCGTADMGGWDTIYAVRVPIINSALRRHFDGKDADALTFEHEKAGATIRGTFGAWQLTTGGSGTRLVLSVPILSGAATVPMMPALEYDLAGARALIEVTLGFHDVEPLPKDGSRPGGMRTHLKVDTGSGSAGYSAPGSSPSDGKSGATPPAAAPETTINVLGIEGAVNKAGPNPFDELALPMIGRVLRGWLASNTDIFDFVFLSVDVAEHVEGSFVWVAPTYVGYAISDVKDDDGKKLPIEHSIFGVLAMTEGRSPKGVGDNVSPNSIPINEGVNAAFLISPRLLMRKFLAPGLPALFGVEEQAFLISDNGKSITNAIDLPLKLEMENGTYIGSNPVSATIPAGDFSMSINDTHIAQEFLNITFPYGNDDELNVQVSLAGNSLLGLDGNGHFAMQMEPNPRASISAQPDQRKVAKEQLWSLGITLVLMIASAFVFSRMAGAARNLGKTASKGAEKALTAAETQAAEEIASTVESGATRAVPVEVAAEATTLASTTLTAEVVETAGAELQQGGKWALSGLMQNFCLKTLVMMISQSLTQLAGQLWGNVSSFDLLSLYKNDPAKLPTLVDFGSHCVSTMAWPHTEGAELRCAGLNGPLVLGFDLALAPEPTQAAPQPAQA